MSQALATVRPYFKAAMLTLSTDYREWEDAFNIDNIPNSELPKAYHLALNGATLVSMSLSCFQFDVNVTLNVWEKGFKTPKDAVDSGAKKIEAIIKECCRHSRRLSQPSIKNVVPSGFNLEAISSTNDNTARLVIQFTCRVIIDVET